MIQSTHIQRRCFEIIFERVESNREEVNHPSPLPPDIENILRQNNVEKCIVREQ